MNHHRGNCCPIGVSIFWALLAGAAATVLIGLVIAVALPTPPPPC